MTDSIPNSPPPIDPKQPAPKRRKKRWWLRILLSLLVLIVLLIAFAPTIASTGFSRSIVVGKINDQLNGSVSIADWSIGWTGGISVSDIKVFDAQKQEVLSIARLKTDLSLINAAKGNLALGDTVVTDLNLKKLVINENGSTNLDDLAKHDAPADTKSPGQPKSSPSSTKLPNITGKFTVGYQAHIEGAGLPAPVNILPSSAVVTITEINQPITNDVKLNIQVGHGQTGAITLIGKADVADGFILNIDKADVDEKLSVNNVDLGAINALLAKLGMKLDVGGMLGGDLALLAKGTKDLSADGQFAIATLSVGGELLKGDHFASKAVTIPIKMAISPTPDGADSHIKIDALGMKFDQGSINLSADASQQNLVRVSKSIPAAIRRALAGSTPAAPTGGDTANSPATRPGDGALDLTVDLDLAAMAGQLKNSLALQKGTELKSGRFKHRTTVTIGREAVPVDTQTTINNVAGTNGGKPVTLDPIAVSATVDALGVKDLIASLSSSFLTVDAKAPRISQLLGSGKFDLAQVRRQLDPFVNLDELVNGPGTQKKVALAGTGDFNIATEGDPTSAEAVIKTTAGLNLVNIDVAGIKDFPPLKQSRTAINLTANAPMSNGSVRVVESATVTVQAGEAASPIIDLAAAANDVDLTTFACKFALTKLNIPDLARVQQEFGAFVPALQSKGIQITAGQLATQVAGSFDGRIITLNQALKLQTPGLTVTRKDLAGVVRPLLTNENLRVTAAGKFGSADGISADLSELSVTTSSNLFSLAKTKDSNLQFSMSAKGTMQGNGAVVVAADLKKLKSLGEAFSAAAPAAGAGNLQDGQLDATLKLASSQQGTTVNLDGALSKLSISTNEQPISNETVKLALVAASKDLSTFDVTGQVQSSFVTTDISKTQVTLGVGLWDTVSSAVIDVTAPDLKKLQTVMNAFTPPPPVEARPAAAVEEPTKADGPLEITRGSAVIKVNLTRDKAAKVTKIDISDVRFSKLAIKRDARTYQFEKDVALKLSAEINAADDASGKKTIVQQIRDVKITQMSGDLNVATLSMPQPIVVSGLGATPQASGAFKLEGTLDAAKPMLAVLQGADELPYRGGYALNQNVKSDGKLITLDGDLVVNDFQVLDAKNQKPAFTEPKITLRNQIDLDPASRSVLFRTVDLAMPQSQAVALKLNGRFLDWQTKRQFAGFEQGRPMTLDLSYDLEKIWPILYPTLTPEQQESYKDVKIAGKYTKRFNLAGGYAAADKAGKILAFNQAIRGLVADGSFSVAKFEGSGLTVENLDVPLYLKAGKLQTVFGDALSGKADETKPPKPATCNGGEIDLGNILIDLSADVPRITLPKNRQIVKNISINPALGDSLGKYINPVFANSKRAEGRATVMVDFCDEVALGDKLKSPQSGSAKIVFSLAQMDIANPFGSLLLGPVFSAFGNDAASRESDTFRGEIRNGVVTLEKGVTTQQIVMTLKELPNAGAAGAPKPKPDKAAAAVPLTFDGTIDLNTLKQDLRVNIPSLLVSVPGVNAQDLAQMFPDGFPVIVRGTTVKSAVDFGNMAAKIAQAQAEFQIKKALGGGSKSNAKDGSKDAGNKDPLGGLLEQLGGINKKKDEKKK